jgi:cupin 2 domain-containing protein
MRESVKSIFAVGRPAEGAEEFALLYENSALRIESIVSSSHQSPDGVWYDQDEDEWVLVVRGAAVLEFDGGELAQMKEGDYLLIPRRVRHRVKKTGDETVWVAVHLKTGNSR